MKRVFKSILGLAAILIFIVMVVGFIKSKQNQVDTTCQAVDSPECNVNRINTAGWVDSPYISPDGNQFYFMYNQWDFFPTFEGGQPVKKGPKRPGYDSSSSNPYDNSDVYMAVKKSDGTWDAPVRLFKGCCAMPTSDGKRFYYQKAMSGSQINTDLFYIEKNTLGKFGDPVNLGAKVNSDKIEDNPHISKDEQTLYWTSQRSSGYGKNDLWYATKQSDGSWSDPINMGSNINTAEDEDQIWVSSDGNTAYFNRGIEIFKSTRRNGVWSRAEKIRFAGSAFMPGGEPSLTEDQKQLYFVRVDIENKKTSAVYSTLQANGVWSSPKPLD